MLYWIYQLWKEAQESGADWAETFSFLRILGYISVRAGLATLIAFMLTLLIGERVIRKLISMKVCLLYTSPSPRDRTRSRMPSSA